MERLTLTTPHAIVPSALHRALAAVVPIEGLDSDGAVVILRRERPPFSDAERLRLVGIIAAHDAPAIFAERKARTARQAVERAKDPATLSLIDRITRLEVLLELERPITTS